MQSAIRRRQSPLIGVDVQGVETRSRRGRDGYVQIEKQNVRVRMCPDPWRQILIGLIFAVGAIALLLGIVTVWRTNPNGSFTNNAVETTMLNVTEKTNLTDVSIDNAWIDQADMGAVEAENGTFVRVTSDEGSIQTLTSQSVTTSSLEASEGTIETLESTTGTIETLMSEQAMISQVKTDVVCPNTFIHTENGVIPETHQSQLLVGIFAPPGPTSDPFVALPLEPAAYGVLTPLTSTSLGNGLKFRQLSDGSIGPVEVVDRSGEKYIQLGTPEPVYLNPAEPDPGVEPVFDQNDLDVEFTIDTASMPAGNGAVSALIDVHLVTSSEFEYDYIRVFKNGELVSELTGEGVDASNPFVEATVTDIVVTPGDIIILRFHKDSIYYGGFDYALFQVRNMRYYTGEIKLGRQMTLPEDLSAYAGKRFQVCSEDGTEHTITRTNGHMDGNSLWSQVQFQSDARCCVDFSVQPNGQVSVLSGISSQCALYCEGFLCVDPQNPEESNPLIGDWLQETFGNFNSVYNVLYRIELEGNRLRLTRHSGSPFSVIREWSAYERAIAGPSIPHSEFATLTSTTSFRYINWDYDYNAEESELLGFFTTFDLQSDQDVAVTWLTFDVTTPGTPVVYTRVKSGDDHSILPSNTDSTGKLGVAGSEASSYNVNSIVNQFREMTTLMRTMMNPQMSDDLESSVYPGEVASRALENLIIEEGFGMFTVNITDIWPSFHDCFYFCGAGGGAPTTAIFTDRFSEVANSVRVTIEGLGTGSDPNTPFKVLNGDHRATRGGDESMDAGDLVDKYLPTHYDHSTNRYMFNVDVDTTDIRITNRFYHPEVDGAATITIKYMPIRENMSPGDYFAASNKWLVENIFQVHTFSAYPVDSQFHSFETFDDLHAAGESGNTETDYGDTRYLVPVMNGGSRSTGNTAFVVQNDRYEMPAKYENPFSIIAANMFHTPEDNYLSEVYQMWWAIDPNTASDPSDITGNLASLGYNADGSRFMFTYAPKGTTPTHPYPGAPQAADGTDWRILRADEDPSQRALSFGRVNPALVSEETAYIFVPDESHSDRKGFMYGMPQFRPDGTQGYPALAEPFRGVSIFVYMYSIMFEKIQSWTPTRLLIDSRYNTGGFPDQTRALASFLGDTRTSATRNTYVRDVGYGHTPVHLYDDFVADGIKIEAGVETIQAVLDRDKVNVQAVRDILGPSLVFDGAGKRVTVLTHISSGSSGDIFSWYFIGDNPTFPRDMGANVTLEIIGNTDARLGGASGRPISSYTNKDTILEIFGTKRSYIRMNAENSDTLGKPGYPSMVNQHPATAPDLLLDSWIGSTDWVDEGIITPYPDPPLPGWTAAGSIQEVTNIVFDTATTINQNSYFTLDSVTTGYYVWYNKDAGGVDPAIGGKTGIEVAISSGDSAEQVAIATVNEIGPVGEFFLPWQSATSLNIRNKIAGTVDASTDVGSTGLAITQVQASASGVVGEVLTSDKSTYRDRWLEKAILF